MDRKRKTSKCLCYSNNIYSSSAIINDIFHGVIVKNVNILEKLLVTK